MKKHLQKFAICFFAVLFTIEPILQLNQIPKAKADEATEGSSVATETEPIADDGTFHVSQPQNIDDEILKIPLRAKTTTPKTNSIINELAGLHSDEDQAAGIGLEEALSNQVEPRIVLNGDDQQALKIYWRLSGTWMMPDFEREPESIWEQYPKFDNKFKDEKPEEYARITTLIGHEKISSVADVATIKVADNGIYLDLTHYAQLDWKNHLGDVQEKVKALTSAALHETPRPTIPPVNVIEMISDVTGETVETINQIFIDNQKTDDSELVLNAQSRYENLMTAFDENIKPIKIDIRVINLLVYLVTPKTQGGAGHWKIKVKRILSGYTSPKKQFSRESEAIYNTTTNNTTGKENVTAADWGQNRSTDTQNTTVGTNPQSLANPSPLALLNGSSTASAAESTDTASTPQTLLDDDPDAFATITDSDGESYNGFVSSAMAADDFPTAATQQEETEAEKNISAHADGQAVDISEVDDIRCTLIKKRRIKKIIPDGTGNYSRSKFSQRPIKLEWQTEKGFSDSGGGDMYKADMANVLKSFANDSIKDLVSELGGDASDYNGDLSSAGFGDIATLIGKSIFSQILNSSGADLKGYQFSDTLTQLGGMYMADYLGLPREMFTQGTIPDSYDELASRIGAAAVETRLQLPIGTFGGKDLDEMLQKVGQRKLETEMNLETGSLDNYFENESRVGMPADGKQYLIGQAVIEKELQLKKRSYSDQDNTAPEDFAALKSSIGKLKSSLVFRDPAYDDNLLHLTLGTTKQLIDGKISPYTYAALVGQIRQDDTIYGMGILAAKNASYGLDPDSFEKMLRGDEDAKEVLISFGLNQMANVFTTGKDEREAFIQWVTTNRSFVGPGAQNCGYDFPVKVTLPSGKVVTLSDSKAVDAGMHSEAMFQMFACRDTNPSAVMQTVGSKILFNTLVQAYLTPEEKIKFNLKDINPQLHSNDPDKLFYMDRIKIIHDTTELVRENWKLGNQDPEYIRVAKVFNDSYEQLKDIIDTSMSITTIDQAKKEGRSIAVAINKLKSDIVSMRHESSTCIKRINGTIIDLNKITKAIAEIIADKEIASTDTITLNEIPANSFVEKPDNTVNAPALNEQRSPRSSNSSLIGLTANKTTFMALLARKIKPADFFLILAADKVEISLNLPQNSLVYFVQNYEKRGLGAVESFYTAIGQAKIEEAFNMPSKYFQGEFISNIKLDMPDFRNDLEQLYYWAGSDVADTMTKKQVITYVPKFGLSNPSLATLSKGGTISNPIFDASEAEIPKTDSPEYVKFITKEEGVIQLSDLKAKNPSSFNFIVQRAEKRFQDDFDSFIQNLKVTDRDLETSVWDIVDNIDDNNLFDKIRKNGESDLLFRMGFSTGVTIEGLSTNSTVAWSGGAAKRANQIDTMLGIPQGTTRSLFTGSKIVDGSGTSRLSNQDKQILVAKMGISPVAIDKLLQFISGEIQAEDLTEIKKNGDGSYTGRGVANDVTNLGDNPYIQAPDNPDGSANDSCSALAMTQVDGVLKAATMVKNSWFYFDNTIDSRNGGTWGSQAAAEAYRNSHTEDKVTYAQELAYGLAKVTGYSKDEVDKRINNFINNINNEENPVTTVFTGEMDDTTNEHIEKSMGVSRGALEKLFSKATTTESSLVAYKRAVGRQVVKKNINSKIFNALGLRIDPSLFTGNEFFEIMQGNYTSLWNIAGSMIDQKLNIPRGSTINILTAPTANLRNCAVSEIGGSILGKFVGLDYVSLKGNIYENIGRARLEKTLGLPRNSFSGETIEDVVDASGKVTKTGLLSNLGVVNFYTAFKYPLQGVDLDTTLYEFYDRKYVDSIKNNSNGYKLQKIKEFADINPNLSVDNVRWEAYSDLQKALVQHVHDTSGKALLSDHTWRDGNYGNDSKDEVVAYLNKIDLLDSTFGITKYNKKNSTDSATARMISGVRTDVTRSVTVTCGINPDGSELKDGEGNYHWTDCSDNERGHSNPWGEAGPGNDWVTLRDPVTNAIAQIRAPSPANNPSSHSCNCESVASVGQIYDYEISTESKPLSPNDYVKKISTKSLVSLAAYDAMDLFGFDMSDEQKNAVVTLIANFHNWSQDSNTGYAKIYSGLSTIFSLHLDEKAGLDEGSIGKMIENPGKIADVLLPQAAKKIDEQLHLNPAEKWSFSGVYARYFTSPDAPASKESDCSKEQKIIDETEYMLRHPDLDGSITKAQANLAALTPGTAESDRLIAETKKQIEILKLQKDVHEWINTHSGITDYTDPKYHFSAAGAPRGTDFTNDPGYPMVASWQDAINKGMVEMQGFVVSCKADNRKPSDSGFLGQDFQENTGGGFFNKASSYLNERYHCDKAAPTKTPEDEKKCNALANSSNKAVFKEFFWTIISDLASDKIHDQILKVSHGTVDMPASDIIHFFQNGDMRYFTAALVSYSANTYLNKLSTNEKDQTLQTPVAWQIPYGMIKLWIVGDSESEEYAEYSAANNIMHPDETEENFEATIPPMGYNDVFNYEYKDKSFFGTFSSLDFDTQSQNNTLNKKKMKCTGLNCTWDYTNSTPKESDLVGFNKKQTDVIYNSGTPVDIGQTKKDVEESDQVAQGCREDQQLFYNDETNPGLASSDDNERQKARNKIDAELVPGHSFTKGEEMSACFGSGGWVNENANIHAQMQAARAGVRDRYKKQAEYRMLDATLWTKDKNVFPGFSYMLFEGSAKQKTVAIGLYLKNGLINGQFFGKDIHFLQAIEEKTGISAWDWKLVVDMGIALTKIPLGKADETLAQLEHIGATTAVAKFIEAHSDNWFGFKIDESYGKAFVTGLTTGHWGLSLGDGDYVNQANGKTYDTVGSIYKAELLARTVGPHMEKAFAWADKHADWKPGTAKDVFNAAKVVYSSMRLYSKICKYQKIHNAAQDAMFELSHLKGELEDLQKAGASASEIAAAQTAVTTQQAVSDAANATSAAFISRPSNQEAVSKVQDGANFNFNKAKAMAWAVVGQLITDYISKAVMRWIFHDGGSDKLMTLEQKFGLIPGSTQALIAGIVGWGVGMALFALFPNAGLFGPVGYSVLIGAILVWVVINAFNVYGFMLKCSANGYYPQMESPSSANDISNVQDVWNGNHAPTNQAKTIQAAQYKAKRLVLDVLEMHKNPLYQDTYASQIMTGRDADVVSLNDKITENMCSKIGLISIHGICGGNTQAGVWENAQMAGYTHIGF